MATAEVSATGVIDIRDPKRNMYGCLPCPKCKSVYRAPFRRDGRLVILCDCDFQEPGAWAEGSDG